MGQTSKAKTRLQETSGSLRAVAKEFGINYHRLANGLNGWVKLKPEEIKMLGLTKEEIKEIGWSDDEK